MKLSATFARYLYKNRQLNLPGIGIFLIDPSVPEPDVNDRYSGDFARNIRFEQKNVTKADDAFIDFIRTETGKIRPLAESDLDSFLSDGKILLNIGKPFILEGIGMLQKTREGSYEFSPGTAVFSKADVPPAPPAAEKPARAVHPEEFEAEGKKSRGLWIAISVIVGLSLVIWLGYGLYNRNASIAGTEDTETVTTVDTGRANTILDSVRTIIDSVRTEAAAVPVGNYKFIIEKTSNKARALRRFTQIKDNRTAIRLDAREDSTRFELYFLLPAAASDTARIRDSLKIWYGRTQVWIER